MTGAAGTAARAEGHAAELGTGTAYTLLAALGFAAVSTLTTIATGEHLSLFTVLAWRYTLGAVVMVGYVGARAFPRMPWSEALKFIVVGGGGQALLVGMALSSTRWISVATLAFLFYTYPAWVTLVQTVRGAERPTVRRLVALALSFGGTILMVGAPSGAKLPWQGVALALGAAVVYGMYIPTMQFLQKSYRVTVTSAYGKIGSALCFLALAVGEQSFTASMSRTAWLAIGALTLFSTVLPSVFFMMGLLRLGPVRTAIVSTIEPFLTAILGAVVLRQALRGDTLLGGAMIVAAVVVLQMRRERVA
jgi:drug/metabolite transporter (DMT)-like permease